MSRNSRIALAVTAVGLVLAAVTAAVVTLGGSPPPTAPLAAVPVPVA